MFSCLVHPSRKTSGAHVEKGGTKTSAGGVVNTKGCREALKQSLDKNAANMSLGVCPSFTLKLVPRALACPSIVHPYAFLC